MRLITTRELLFSPRSFSSRSFHGFQSRKNTICITYKKKEKRLKWALQITLRLLRTLTTPTRREDTRCSRSSLSVPPLFSGEMNLRVAPRRASKLFRTDYIFGVYHDSTKTQQRDARSRRFIPPLPLRTKEESNKHVCVCIQWIRRLFCLTNASAFCECFVFLSLLNPSCCVILLTHQPTNGHGWKHNYRSKGNKKSVTECNYSQHSCWT